MSSPSTAIPPRARLAVRAVVLAGLLAAFVPTYAHAGIPPNPVEVSVHFAGRVGFPGDVFAVVLVRSVLGAPVIGDLSIDANGQRRKLERVSTASQALVSVNLGRVTGPVMACTTFGGMADVGDENWASVQAAACGQYAGPPIPREEPRSVRLPMPVLGTGPRLP